MNTHMRRERTGSPVLRWGLTGLAALAVACGGRQAAEEERSEAEALREASFEAAERGGPAVIRGTTIDAASGQPLPGVAVQGPGGTTATSDRDGRFELPGLPVGFEGELVATSDDGRSARNPLRPLKEGPLEVVLVLRKGAKQ